MSALPQERPATATTHGKILIVDDDEQFLKSTGLLLRSQGHTCDTVATVPEAKEALKAADYDLLIADIFIPGNTDLEMLRELAKQDGSPSILLVTGQPTMETAVEAVQLRVAAYLAKPLDPPHLLRLAAQEIRNRRLYSLVRARRHQTETALSALRQFETTLRDNAQYRPSREALATYLDLTSTQLLSAAADLRSLVEALAGQSGPDELRERLSGARPFVLLAGVREAIQVLERTKNSFKSKELAELRRKLEALLTASPEGAS